MTEPRQLGDEVATRARDALYVAVGLGVLGLQRAQVERVALQRRLAEMPELDQRLHEAQELVAGGLQQLDGVVEGAARALRKLL